LVDRATGERYPEDFLAEAREIVQALSEDVLVLEERASSGAVDPGTLQRMFRGAHSLKGLAGMFGAAPVASLSHALEDLLDALRLGRERVTREVLDLLFEVPGVLEALLGGQPADEAAAELAGRLRAMAGPQTPVLLPPPPFSLPREVLDVLTEYEIFRLHEAASRGRSLYGVRQRLGIERLEEDLTQARARLSALGEVVSAVPMGSDDGRTLSFTFLLASDLAASDLACAVGEDVEAYACETPVPVPPPAPAVAASPPGSVRVDIAQLDALMSIAGELGITRSTLGRLAERLRAEPGLAGYGLELAREVRTLERQLCTLREGILDARLVPLAPLFARMARVVRGLARETGKEVTLFATGGETEIDKLMVEQISDPLVHLLRNAFDHGIEPVETRIRRGKASRGQIALAARSDGNRVVITVRDDGAGIDLDHVRSTAVARGLISAEEAKSLDERGTLSLLFLPGFSTRPQVSEISGRGVGLDVVKTNIGRLSGSIEVETRLGEWTCFTLTLPVTLAILPALLVRTAGETVALPVSAVRETAMPPLAERHGSTLHVRGERIPCFDLGSRLRFRSEERDGDALSVVVAVGERRVAMLVDDVVGQQDVVVKPLGRLLGDVPGVAGVAELGGGDLVLVLDLGALVGVEAA
jgi:two-component system chemotaxis sensor kinase CheA